MWPIASTSARIGSGIIPRVEPPCCPSFALAMESYGIAKARSKSSSTSGKGSLIYVENHGKMGTPTVFPHRNRETHGYIAPEGLGDGSGKEVVRLLPPHRSR